MLSLLLLFFPPELSLSVNSAISVTLKWWTSSRSRLLLIFLFISEISEVNFMFPKCYLCLKVLGSLMALFRDIFGSMEILSLSLPEKIVCENICLLLKALLIHVCFSPPLFWSYPGLQPDSTGISRSNIQSNSGTNLDQGCMSKERKILDLFHFN